MANPDYRPGVSLDEASRWLVLTPGHVTRLVTNNIIPKTSRGKYELEHVVPAYIKYLRSRAAQGDAADKTDPKRRLLVANAEAAEIKLAALKGDLIAIEDVGLRAESEYAAVRANLLALPAEIAPDLEHRDSAAISELLSSKIEEILSALSADQHYAAAAASRAGERDSAEASAEDEFGGMGGYLSDCGEAE